MDSALANPADSAAVSQRPVSNPGSSKKSGDRPRLLGLDLLRFMAVTMVIFAHLSLSGNSLSFHLLNPVHTAGWAGVTVFFVLSGFLISGLLFQEYQKTGDARVGRFLIRRGWKIYPAFWTLIAFTVLLWDFGLWSGFSRKGLIGEGLFLQNYISGLWFNTWSLAVEEHFYFLFAGLVFLMLYFHRRKPQKTSNPFSAIPTIFAIMALACLVGRILTGSRLMDDGHVVDWHGRVVGWLVPKLVYPSHLRIDSLMFGVLVSYWWHFSPPEKFRARVRRWRIPLLFAGAACLAPAFIWNVEKSLWVAVYGVMLFSLGTGLLVLSLISFSELDRVPLFKQIGKLGTYSYSAYLWHGPFVVLGMSYFRTRFASIWNNWVDLLVCFTCTWILGIVTARIVEMPVLRLREHYCPAPVTTVRIPSLDNGKLSINLTQSQAAETGVATSVLT